jgi:hypothetical protein
MSMNNNEQQALRPEPRVIRTPACQMNGPVLNSRSPRGVVEGGEEEEEELACLESKGGENCDIR